MNGWMGELFYLFLAHISTIYYPFCFSLHCLYFKETLSNFCIVFYYWCHAHEDTKTNFIFVLTNLFKNLKNNCFKLGVFTILLLKFSPTNYCFAYSFIINMLDGFRLWSHTFHRFREILPNFISQRFQTPQVKPLLFFFPFQITNLSFLFIMKLYTICIFKSLKTSQILFI